VSPPPGLRRLAGDLAALDQAVYAAVARQETPTLDGPLRRLSGLADNSVLWFLVAGTVGVAGGGRARRAAAEGMAAVGAASLVVNLVCKSVAARHRPADAGLDVPLARQVPLPRSSSFPSGHSASAFAFATAVGARMPWLALPLRALATTVAYSRIHTGVHYPSDTVAGALIGTVAGQTVARLSAASKLSGLGRLTER
jgi:membrane-associated phospholipid phosphatase